jgi:hypothetical protein
MSILIKTLAIVAAGTVLALGAFAQSARGHPRHLGRRRFHAITDY